MPSESPAPRRTVPTLLLLSVLAGEPGREFYGIELSKLAELKTGTIHPILIRIEQAGWVTSRWEDPAVAAADGHRPRRYYRITGAGQAVLVEAAQQRREAATAKSLRERLEELGFGQPLGGPETAGATG